ncbi:MAG: type II toxin-antitoxin system HicB family antitoxin [Agathobaculum sp.]|jgi:predicted HicB family RNase H-like nuclease|uniref:type II toxin-antitoxin system HicB family antitoxin n=1 Tax=Agathobaculum sp. TaxID=2048138 RepID=UPI003D91A315
MNNTITYKGYIGTIEFSEEDCIFFGKVLGLHSLISYEGATAKELLDDFHGAIDDYLQACADNGIEPEKAFKGSFNVRVSPDLHKQLAQYAAENQVTLNRIVESALQSYVTAHAN